MLEFLKAPLLFILHISNQSTTNHTITGDFADNKTIMTLHLKPEIASNSVLNHTLTYYKTSTNNSESK